MSGRAKRVTVPKKVYEEVESDADMEEEEKGIVTKKSAPGDAYSPATAPPKKKARKDTARQLKLATEAKAAARLSLFPEMPLDVINEVFSHLHLRDFLQIMRISKMFRSLLFSENMQGVWTAARKRLNLPLPKGLSEIQLAALCFGKSCMFCHKKVERVEFCSRIRSCYKCYQAEVNIRNHGTFIRRAIEADALHPQAQFCIPHQKTGGRWNRAGGYKILVYDREMLDIERCLADVSDQLNALARIGNVVEQSESRSARVARRGAEGAAVRSVAAAPVNEKLEEFVKEKRAWIKQTRVESDALEVDFSKNALKERQAEEMEKNRLQQLRLARRAAIIAKATELGYTEDHMNYVSLYGPDLASIFAFSEEEWQEKREAFIVRFEEGKATDIQVKAQRQA